MIGGLKIILVKDGHEKEFESLFGELRGAMNEHEPEPECLLYSLLKSRTNSRAYIVQEQYRNEAALEKHQTSEHGKIYFSRIRASWKAFLWNISIGWSANSSTVFQIGVGRSASPGCFCRIYPSAHGQSKLESSSDSTREASDARKYVEGRTDRLMLPGRIRFLVCRRTL